MTINIIIGPPCAGKSTHVQANRKDGDVVVDYDLLAQALGSNVSHQSTGAVRQVALSARRSAIDTIISGIDSDSWVIHTNPPKQLITDYVDAGAVFTIVDPGIDDCKQRAEDTERPEGTIAAIEKWYESIPVIPSDALIDDLSATVQVMQNLIYTMKMALEPTGVGWVKSLHSDT